MENDEAQRLSWIRDQLGDALHRLSLPAAEQIDWLSHLGVPIHSADELALEFGDFVMLAPQLRAAFPISDETLNRLKEVDAALDQMSGLENAQLWTFDALTNDSSWENVRALAVIALSSWEHDGMSTLG